MNKPDELRTNKDLPIVENDILSKEWVDKEEIPTFETYYKGKPVDVARFENKYYLMRKTTKAVAGPIPLHRSGRK